jgi:hypothetical protein
MGPDAKREARGTTYVLIVVSLVLGWITMWCVNHIATAGQDFNGASSSAGYDFLALLLIVIWLVLVGAAFGLGEEWDSWSTAFIASGFCLGIGILSAVEGMHELPTQLVVQLFHHL